MNMATVTQLKLTPPLDLSVIIPVTGRYDAPETLYASYSRALKKTGRTYEIIYVLDGPYPLISAMAERLAEAGAPVKAIGFNREFGEAACLREGAKRAVGNAVLFLPAYSQIDPDAIQQVLDQLRTDDIVVASRDRRNDRPLNRLRSWGFEMVARIAGSRYADPGCVVRAVRRRVLDEVPIQDEQHRFLPLMAELHGFRVGQVTVPQATSDARRPQHRPSIYLNVVLDLFAVAFLLRFIQKPFRFFGTIGAVSIILSVLLGIYLLYERQVTGVPMSDRPLLVLDALLVIVGVQIAAIGLVAEIVLFTRNDGGKHYHIDTIVEEGQPIA
ncbi:glycosyltransferase [Sphingobium sp. SCG-1]|uniref:glycosyltransferase n=1 Tax=Sphingobium sp. SCG-1 TaxID=2072936 RepID=UPI001CB92139|nr:glycosyltransferase [Sphingobium sp. SCG-1]